MSLTSKTHIEFMTVRPVGPSGRCLQGLERHDDKLDRPNFSIEWPDAGQIYPTKSKQRFFFCARLHLKEKRQSAQHKGHPRRFVCCVLCFVRMVPQFKMSLFYIYTRSTLWTQHRFFLSIMILPCQPDSSQVTKCPAAAVTCPSSQEPLPLPSW